LPPLVVNKELIFEKAARDDSPSCPPSDGFDTRTIFGLSPYDSQVLTHEREISDYFESIAKGLKNVRTAAELDDHGGTTNSE